MWIDYFVLKYRFGIGVQMEYGGMAIFKGQVKEGNFPKKEKQLQKQEENQDMCWLSQEKILF